MKNVDRPLRMLRPVPVYIIGVGSLSRGIVNIATVSWVTPLSKIPSRIGVVLDQSSYTFKLLKEYGKFTLSIVDSKLLELAKYIGTRTGREGDKVKETGVKLAPAGDGETPYIVDAPGYVLVRVEKIHDYWGTTLFAGPIIEAKAREELFNSKSWVLDRVDLPLHLAKHEFIMCKGEKISVIKTRWGIAMKKPWRDNIDESKLK